VEKLIKFIMGMSKWNFRKIKKNQQNKIGYTHEEVIRRNVAKSGVPKFSPILQKTAQFPFSITIIKSRTKT
jgi:hypothetical protein